MFSLEIRNCDFKVLQLENHYELMIVSVLFFTAVMILTVHTIGNKEAALSLTLGMSY